eukprot:gene14760-19960_t
MPIIDSVPVEISVVLGTTTMPIHQLLRMGRGAVIELDSSEKDPLKIYANNTLIANGEVKVEDGHLSVEITEKGTNLSPDSRLNACGPPNRLLHAASLGRFGR